MGKRNKHKIDISGKTLDEKKKEYDKLINKTVIYRHKGACNLLERTLIDVLLVMDSPAKGALHIKLGENWTDVDNVELLYTIEIADGKPKVQKQSDNELSDWKKHSEHILKEYEKKWREREKVKPIPPVVPPLIPWDKDDYYNPFIPYPERYPWCPQLPPKPIPCPYTPYRKEDEWYIGDPITNPFEVWCGQPRWEVTPDSYTHL